MAALLSCRLATDEDLEKAKEVADVANEAFLAEGWASARHFKRSERFLATDIENYITSDKHGIYMVLNEAQEVVGTLMVEFRDGGKVYMGILTTKPGWQSMGVGNMLMHKAISDTKALGYKTAEIAVVENRDQLFAWYNRLGFFETGHEQVIFGECFHNNRVRILTMEKQLTETA
ncbi:acyl-CoA N-acyltransferase [Hesseltinella vesiculosa]|uniref:Acyl-CoA N-acyltransferase n=1 Tax=Hesseltinella vesiculosa TaxID=101127 RepID=A0A1X2GE86_9FUNG|nr:acyl-CoA N-acyltransferase [Hesseltinella vesiculosa]